MKKKIHLDNKHDYTNREVIYILMENRNQQMIREPTNEYQTRTKRVMKENNVQIVVNERTASINSVAPMFRGLRPMRPAVN